jgi:hypothetical protein
MDKFFLAMDEKGLLYVATRGKCSYFLERGECSNGGLCSGKEKQTGSSRCTDTNAEQAGKGISA